jgi:DNA invertase Pin-like site-specific DNA recombinase
MAYPNTDFISSQPVDNIYFLGYTCGMKLKPITTKHAIQLAADKYGAGSVQKLARLLGISASAVYRWGEFVPDNRPQYGSTSLEKVHALKFAQKVAK